MARWMLEISAGLLLLFAALTAGMTALGAGQPAQPGLDGFRQDCDGQPPQCWYGIVPGVTRRDEALRRVQAAGFLVPEIFQLTSPDGSFGVSLDPADKSSLCRAHLHIVRETVRIISLRYCGAVPLQLGDLMLLWPASDAMNFITDTDRVYGGIRVNASGWRTPREQVFSLNVFPPTSQFGLPSRWRGYIPVWRFCQLEPDAYICYFP